MQIVIPLAGFGKRLRPHTFTKPKPLINVAGKPMLGHVLDTFAALDNVDEIIFIVGHLGEQIEEYVAKEYPHLRARYFRQEELNGQSTAIYLAREYLRGPMLMAFVDTIIKTDLAHLKDETADAVTWVKAVEDPRPFGVAEVTAGDTVKRLIEKPNDMRNNLVVVGFYYFKESESLVEAIREQIERDIRTQNEYFLADAINLMLARGLVMRVQRVDVWLDCGKTETVLETNRYLLENGHDNSTRRSTFTPPPRSRPRSSARTPRLAPTAKLKAPSSAIRSWTRKRWCRMRCSRVRSLGAAPKSAAASAPTMWVRRAKWGSSRRL